MTTRDHIYDWLKDLGHKIAEHAEPLKGMGGDHDYDGVIDVVWRGIHEALDVDNNCHLHGSTRNCDLAKHANRITYTGPSQSGGPVPDQHPDDAFRDGYDWAQVIDTVYDENAHTNKTQDAILDMVINRANEDRELTQAILKAYREVQED